MSTTTTICPACLTAAEVVHNNFREHCTGCCARAASRSPHYRRVRDAGGLQDRAYKLLLLQFGLTHDQVRAAADADALGKRK